MKATMTEAEMLHAIEEAVWPCVSRPSLGTASDLKILRTAVQQIAHILRDHRPSRFHAIQLWEQPCPVHTDGVHLWTVAGTANSDLNVMRGDQLCACGATKQK